MLPLTADPEKDFPEYVRRWFQLLSENRMEDACALIDEPDQFGRTWTPAFILKVVHDTLSPDTIFYRDHPEGPVFTTPYGLEERPLGDLLFECDDYGGYCVDMEVPLNGERSDLTAQFEFLKRPNGYAVSLQNLHVM